MRTSKKNREDNARLFYNFFMYGNMNKAAIVVRRIENNRGQDIKCQFLTNVLSDKPIVIAESTSGIEGCFMELLESINPCPQITYFEDGFNDWLFKTFRFWIVYNDDLVIMLKRRK